MFESASVACNVVKMVPTGCSSNMVNLYFGIDGVHGGEKIFKFDEKKNVVKRLCKCTLFQIGYMVKERGEL